ncbi:O-antigen ligase family protein [Pistricoccus aurantiacus]|uniref:O-antigen ligase family protein n=1 Tax=Pistricoccus aurantiacus TaxID=1883414 RepID=UPI003628BC2B
MALSGLTALLIYGKGIRNAAAVWLLFAAIGVQLLSWTLGYFHHPEWVADNPQIDRLAKLFIFIGVAWWLGGSTRNTLMVWLLALLGYLATTFVQGDGIKEWITGFGGQRVGFGIRNNQHASMLFGVALLGLIVFFRRFASPGRARVWRIGLWTCLTIICLGGVLVGQTRAVWLSLGLALPCVGIVWLIKQARHSSTNRQHCKPLIIGAGVFLVLLGGIGTTFHETLKQRLTKESDVIAQLASGNIETLPYSSIGIRIHSWRAAMEWIEKRPLVGWGGEGRSLVIEHTDWLPKTVKHNYGHLHNFFLEIWVAYGALGFVVIAALAVWVGRATWLAWRGGALPGDMALFGAGFFVYWLVINQFESYNSFSTGVFVHNLIVGGLITHYWKWQWKRLTSHSVVQRSSQ